MNFQYKIRNQEGGIISGTGEADSRGRLVRELTRRGFRPIAVVAAPPQQTRRQEFNRPTEVLPKIKIKKRPWATLSFGKPVKDRDILILTRNLLTLTHAGIPTVSGLRDVISQMKNSCLKEILEQVHEDVNGGSRLSDALERHPKAFSEFYYNTIRAGEQSGRMDYVLERLADTLDRDIEIRILVRDAIQYPRMVLCFLACAFVYIISYIIPKMAVLFQSFSTELPLPTRILVALGNFAQHHGLLILVGAVALALGLNRFKKTKKGRILWDHFKLRLPIFGNLIQLNALKGFAGSLQTLHASGVVLPEGLKISAGVVDNRVISRAILEARKEVLEGKPLSEVLAGKQIFPPLVIRMVAIGETSGNLEGMLGEVVHLYEREIRYAAKSIMTLIEPLLTVVLGLMVLVFALGVFLPMWQGLRLFMPK